MNPALYRLSSDLLEFEESLTSGEWALVEKAVDALQQPLSHDEAVRRLLKSVLGLDLLQKSEFREGDHALVAFAHDTQIIRRDTIVKAALRRGRNNNYKRLAFLSLGPTLGRSVLEQLRKAASSSVIVSPERDSETGERVRKRRKQQESERNAGWWVPVSESIARLSEMPRELLGIMLSDASLHELVNLRKTNRSLKTYIDQGDFWRALLLRDFHTSLPISTNHVQAPVALTVREYPLAIGGSDRITNENARRIFLNNMSLTADMMVFVLNTVENMLQRPGTRESKDTNNTVLITLEIGAYNILWQDDDPALDDWTSEILHLQLNSSRTLTPEILYIISGQDRECVEAYEALLQHSRTSGKPWFSPHRTNGILRAFFRQVLLKTDYLHVSMHVDFAGTTIKPSIEMFLRATHHVRLPFSTDLSEFPRLVTENHPNQLMTFLIVRPSLAGILKLNDYADDYYLSYL